MFIILKIVVFTNWKPPGNPREFLFIIYIFEHINTARSQWVGRCRTSRIVLGGYVNLTLHWIKSRNS